MVGNNFGGVNVVNNLNKIPLFEAINENNFEIVKLLIEHGADVNKMDDAGVSPLYLALLSFNGDENRKEILNLLKEKGANLSESDSYGCCLLTQMILLKKEKAYEWLIENEADVNLVDKLNKTPLYHAVESERKGHRPTPKI